MRALTLWQPWATLAAIGAKKIETRSWLTRYRGELAIHAAARMPPDAVSFCLSKPAMAEVMKQLTGSDQRGVWYGYLIGSGRDTIFPLGKMVGVARVVDCFEIPPEPMAVSSKIGSKMVMLPPEEPELSFGDYTPGRYAWILEDARQLAKPAPAKGSLGLWDWDGEL